MWGKINAFVRSQALFSVFLLSVLFISAITALGIFVLDRTPSVRLMVFTMGQLSLSGVAVWLMRRLDVFDSHDFSFKGLGKGILLAWFGIVYMIISFFISFMSIPENSFIAPNWLYLLVVVLHPFIGTGIFEEVLYRGLVLKTLLKKTGRTKRGIFFACAVSSAIFGLLHISNILAGAPVLQTASQMVHATATGFFFAVVFLRTKRLWVSVFFHGLLNVSAQIFNAIVSPDVLQQSAQAGGGTDILGLIIYTLFITLPILTAGLILFRKIEPDEIPGAETAVPSL